MSAATDCFDTWLHLNFRCLLSLLLLDLDMTKIRVQQHQKEGACCLRCLTSAFVIVDFALFEVFIKETWAVIFMSELSMLRKVQWPIEMFEQTMCDDVLTHGKQQLRLWKSICSENQHKLHIILLYFWKWNKLFWKSKTYANNETNSVI